jgi:hypothetical protein
MASQYLCYDIKGIQSFIFKIPKLKFIIGGSILIDQFDKHDVVELEKPGVKRVFSGGGKGTFLCDESQIAELKGQLIQKAHAIGVDIRFGVNESFSVAAQQADELYAYIPEIHEGRPCPVSGLYPVKDDDAHPVVKKRIYRNGKRIDRYFEDRLLKDILVPDVNSSDLEFFRDVSNESDESRPVLAGSNRWAVIAMDGNDMGFQFRHQVSNLGPERSDQLKLQAWIAEMSHALDECSRVAAIEGIQAVVDAWRKTGEWQSVMDDSGGTVVLPIRPLIVGGDDIVVLCHPAYAIDFVKAATSGFSATSRKFAHLWPATNGQLTITAGILVAPITLPLHTAIPYAETLLASAKTRGREKQETGQPSPACIDWEHITDSVIDTPAAKRQRELVFDDEAVGRRIWLTERPYTMQEFTNLEQNAQQYAKRISASTRNRFLPSMTAGYADRLGFYAMIKKNHPAVFEELNEFDKDRPGSAWSVRSNDGITEQTTGFIDALLLLEQFA